MDGEVGVRLLPKFRRGAWRAVLEQVLPAPGPCGGKGLVLEGPWLRWAPSTVLGQHSRGTASSGNATSGCLEPAQCPAPDCLGVQCTSAFPYKPG